MSEKIVKTDAEWREKLTPAQYRILRKQGTEPPFSHPGFPAGTERFACAACGAPLFALETKFESGSGWPSFFRPIDDAAVEERVDNSHGMRRVEVVCARCDGHLGHVFPDGPPPTGQRYCINGAALIPDAED